jgi:hypothetical protein
MIDPGQLKSAARQQLGEPTTSDRKHSIQKICPDWQQRENLGKKRPAQNEIKRNDFSFQFKA